jgi:hypothetical protein
MVDVDISKDRIKNPGKGYLYFFLFFRLLPVDSDCPVLFWHIAAALPLPLLSFSFS